MEKLLIGKVLSEATFWRLFIFDDVVLLWQLAAIRQITVRELHEDYGLTDAD